MNSYNSQIFGGSEEECHSSESGWTMYIVDDDEVDEAKYEVEVQYKGGGGGGDVESDDSMVSDASSANIKKKDEYHHEAKKDDAGQMKNSRKWMKTGAEKIEKPEKKKDKESTSRNAATSRSGKVRRSWLGKKK